MFGWSSPKCPLDLGRKAWIEYRMRWLADRVGIDRLLKATVITPTEEFFPGPYGGTEADVRQLMNQLAVTMKIAPAPDLEILPETEMPGALGRFIGGSPARIQINASTLGDPRQVAATLTHELAHAILIGGGLIDSNQADHEQTTDLLLVFLGVGILAVNSTVRESTTNLGNTSYWQIQKSGYLSAMEFGYALALFAYMRDEEKPLWSRHLRTDAAVVMTKGLRFLQKTGDTYFHPERVRKGIRPLTAAKAFNRLCDGSPTERVIALWQLASKPLADRAVIRAITDNLVNRQEAVAAGAAAALEALGAAAADTAPVLLKCLDSTHPSVRAAAAAALGAIGASSDAVRNAIIYLLRETNNWVLSAAAGALIRIGDPSQASVPALLRAMDAALFRHPAEPCIPNLVLAFMKIDPNPADRIREFYEEGNDEHHLQLVEIMHEIASTAANA